ncbi:MAG: PAS domain S-box protein [Cyanothece sp. SIO1E1]|nr:PAS domain S-box protein [Cyanothece sp. SIO1E1]
MSQGTEALSQAILDSATYIFIATTPDGTITSFNPAAERSLGYSATEVVGQTNLINLHDGDEIAQTAQVLSQELGVTLEPGFEVLVARARRQEPDEREWFYRCQDGSHFPVATAVTTLSDSDSNITGFLFISRDISPHKRAEAELTRFFNLSPDMLCVAGTDGYFKRLNPALESTLGYTKTELLAQPFINFVHPDDQAATLAEVEKLAAGQAITQFENRYRCQDGSYRWFSWTAVPVEDEGLLYAVARDVTKRKQIETESRLQSRRSQLFAELTLKIRQSLHLDEVLQTAVAEVQQFLEADRVVIFQLEPNGSGTIMQESVVPGYTVIIGQNIDDPCFWEEYLEQYRQGRISAITDIAQIETEKSCYIEMLQGFEVRANLVVPIFQQHELWGLLIAHQCAHPRQWSSFETDLLRQLADQIGIALAQAQLLEQETRQRQGLAQSNAELQQFAYVASHDLQEPLRKIQAFGDRLRTKFGEVLTDQGQDYLARMQNAAGRMQVLIDDLMILSRVTTQTQPFVSTDLNQVVQNVLSDLEVRIQQTEGQVEVGSLPTIDADRVQMNQLMQNLISNALKFRRQGHPPIVKIYSQLLLGQEQLPTESAYIANFCQIVVEDNGIGFDEKYLDRIFNAFQRLHGRDEYEGTGIGLAICRRIVERHGGSLKARSSPGQGAAFIVTLPIKPT